MQGRLDTDSSLDNVNNADDLMSSAEPLVCPGHTRACCSVDLCARGCLWLMSYWGVQWDAAELGEAPLLVRVCELWTLAEHLEDRSRWFTSSSSSSSGELTSAAEGHEETNLQKHSKQSSLKFVLKVEIESLNLNFVFNG